MTFLYLDTETMGLNVDTHDIWEIAWAVDDGPVRSSIIPHSIVPHQIAAVRINGYDKRAYDNTPSLQQQQDAESNLYDDLKGATVVGANPSFDTYRLQRRWGEETWRYRMLDISVYAMPAMKVSLPQGLNAVMEWIAKDAPEMETPMPDHTAAADVEAVRFAHWYLRGFYGEE